MALVDLKIHGRSYQVTCDDGQEDHLRALASHLDGKVSQLAAGIGRVDEAQLLVIAALLITDELHEARPGGLQGAEPRTAGQAAASGGGAQASAGDLARASGTADAERELAEQGFDVAELTDGLGRCAERLSALADRLKTV